MLDQSVLIGRGLIRRTAIETLHRQARDGQALPPLLYDMLALDIGIRSMTATARATAERTSPCAPSMPSC